MKKFTSRAAAAAIVAAIMLPACSGTERTEAATADITAAQMQGRNAARDVINTQWQDTSKLVRRIQDDKARSSRFSKSGRPDCAAAFDSAYIGTIRAVKPLLEPLVRRTEAREDSI